MLNTLAGQLSMHDGTMESIAPECTPIKQKYEACFNDWFQRFLKGDTKIPDECQNLFKLYQNCVKPKIDEELEER